VARIERVDHQNGLYAILETQDHNTPHKISRHRDTRIPSREFIDIIGDCERAPRDGLLHAVLKLYLDLQTRVKLATTVSVSY